MNLNTTNKKQLNNRFVELIEVKDNSGKIINYSVRTTYQGRDVVGGGTAKIEEKLFSNKKEAEEFLNNQN